MSVKIEMEMPKSCGFCRFFTKDDCEISYCSAKSEKLWIIPFREERDAKNNRPSWCPLQEVKECIWHKKTERPEKKLHCTRLIVTKFGSVFDEKEIDNGAVIETDWAYLDDLIECAKVKELEYGRNQQ